ncbi:hypothetical protein [Mesobacillus boroniphilus]|nr:hypothetical protein [Mesobacillus boroniphilus]
MVNKDRQNKIKYSIWDTRVDEKQRKIIEKSPELTDGFNNRTSKK